MKPKYVQFCIFLQFLCRSEMRYLELRVNSGGIIHYSIFARLIHTCVMPYLTHSLLRFWTKEATCASGGRNLQQDQLPLFWLCLRFTMTWMTEKTIYLKTQTHRNNVKQRPAKKVDIDGTSCCPFLDQKVAPEQTKITANDQLVQTGQLVFTSFKHHID